MQINFHLVSDAKDNKLDTLLQNILKEQKKRWSKDKKKLDAVDDDLLEVLATYDNMIKQI